MCDKLKKSFDKWIDKENIFDTVMKVLKEPVMAVNCVMQCINILNIVTGMILAY